MNMSAKMLKNVVTFGIIVAAVLIGIAFVMSSSASAAVAVPGAGIVRPAIINEPMVPSKVAPRPFVKPNFNPFFPKVNPFFPRINPFFNVDVNPFFFNQEGFAAD